MTWMMAMTTAVATTDFAIPEYRIHLPKAPSYGWS
jgi:hypothetical protein